MTGNRASAPDNEFRISIAIDGEHWRFTAPFIHARKSVGQQITVLRLVQMLHRRDGARNYENLSGVCGLWYNVQPSETLRYPLSVNSTKLQLTWSSLGWNHSPIVSLLSSGDYVSLRGQALNRPGRIFMYINLNLANRDIMDFETPILLTYFTTIVKWVLRIMKNVTQFKSSGTKGDKMALQVSWRNRYGV